jgi:hypothetical protein
MPRAGHHGEMQDRFEVQRTGSMFRRLREPARGGRRAGRHGADGAESVAARLLPASTIPTSAPRLHCMMGVADCLRTMPNRQACLVQVRDGMKIRRQIGVRAVTE